MQTLKDPLIWIDMEMTGLNLKKDVTIEIAVVVTDGSLETVIHGPDIVINCADSILDSMDEWCTNTHGKSGLTENVKASTVTLEQAEMQVLTFLKECGLTKFTCPLAGNSVHCDKVFI